MIPIKKKDWIEVVLHIAFWIGVFYTVNASTSSAVTIRISHNNTVMERKEVHTLLPTSYITLGLLTVLFYGNILWLFKKILSFRKIFLRFAVAAFWFLLVFAVDNFAVYMLSDHDPIRIGPVAIHRLVDTFKSKGVPHAPPPFSDSRHLGFIMDMADRSQLILLLIFLSILGVSIAYFFLKEWAKADIVRVELEASQLSTEVKFLRSQVNPHFLFNTLNNLFSMAQKKGNDDLADGISKLSGMMRYMLYDSNAGSVPLQKEILYLEDCITLNKLRHADDEVNVLFKYTAFPAGITIAPMLFIPFVENAFKHGVAIGRSSTINIDIDVSDRSLVFNCVNPNYNAIKKMDDEKSRIGLENVKRRLDLLYPGRHSLQLKQAGGNYIVKLQIDLE